VAAADVRPLPELLSLAGRVAVVTGAARGVGLQIARRLVELGAYAVLADLDAAAVQRAARELGDDSVAVGRAVDVRRQDEVIALADAAMGRRDRLDIWVNNAGIQPFAPAMELTPAELHETLQTNLAGTLYGIQEAARRMLAGGVVVNIGSVAQVRHTGNSPAYVASKAAMAALTRTYAHDLGPRGVRVVQVAPTLVETEQVQRARDAGQGDAIDALIAALPLRRAATPDDVARVVAFLATDAAALITGSTVVVDAGDLTRP
jgi:NAD(P)-dependent dehydrogenase (short-subunit alcohol dehydrogenase family)